MSLLCFSRGTKHAALAKGVKRELMLPTWPATIWKSTAKVGVSNSPTHDKI